MGVRGVQEIPLFIGLSEAASSPVELLEKLQRSSNFQFDSGDDGPLRRRLSGCAFCGHNTRWSYKGIYVCNECRSELKHFTTHR